MKMHCVWNRRRCRRASVMGCSLVDSMEQSSRKLNEHVGLENFSAAECQPLAISGIWERSLTATISQWTRQVQNVPRMLTNGLTLCDQTGDDKRFISESSSVCLKCFKVTWNRRLQLVTVAARIAVSALNRLFARGLSISSCLGQEFVTTEPRCSRHKDSGERMGFNLWFIYFSWVGSTQRLRCPIVHRACDSASSGFLLGTHRSSSFTAHEQTCLERWETQDCHCVATDSAV